MRSDNRGLSLVEIIIVISIITILTAAGVIGVNMISGKPAEQCASHIKTSLLNSRTTSLGKFKVDLTIQSTGTSIDVTENMQKSDGTSSATTQKVGEKGVVVSYSYDGSSYTELADGDSLNIGFNRSSGAMEKLLVNGSPQSTNADFYIKCTKAGKDYIVKIYHLNGKVVLL